jgi:tetratricopeptide (TPR) repeat protein
VKSALPFSWNRDLSWGLLLFAATFLAYLPAWNGQPVWDDDAHMTRPELRSAAGLARIWIQPGAISQYYPLVHSVFWVEHRVFGDATPGYHLLNILLHFFSALLLLTILRRLGMSGAAAWLAGGIFALHPVMVESVAWITELKNTLSGVFFLSAALAYLTFDRKREKKHYAIALMLFLFGLFAKSVIVTLPAALLVVFWWKRGSIAWKRDVVPLLPFFAIGIMAGLFTAWVERRYAGAVGSEFNLAFIDRCLIAGRAVGFYLYKLLWPVDLVFIYPRWHIDALAAWQYLFPAAFLLLAVLFWQLRSRSRAPLTVLLYFAVTLFPALGFVNIYSFRYSFVADHFQYLASIGPITAAAACIVQGTGLLKKRLRRPLQPLLSVMLLSVLLLLTWRQSGMYSDAETLYRTTITRNDNCCLAYNNLGLLLAEMGRTDEAMAHFRKALELNPNYADAHNNLGLLLAETGRTDEAMAHFLKALELNPNYADAHYNTGILLSDMGRPGEATNHYQKTLEINSNYDEAHYNLGLLLAEMGRTDEAMAHYKKVLEINPHHANAHNNLGILLVDRGLIDEATAHFQKALEINSDDIGALRNLSFSLEQKGQWTDAISVLKRALALAKSAGDEAQIKTITQTLTKSYETANLSKKVTFKTHAQ